MDGDRDQRVALKARIDGLENDLARAKSELDSVDERDVKTKPLLAREDVPRWAQVVFAGPLLRLLMMPRVWAAYTVSALIFVGGTVFRWHYITNWHDPRKYVYSDMRMYVDLARRLIQPNYTVGIGDITHPPGMVWILDYFFVHYPAPPGSPENISNALVYFNFTVAALVPLAMGALGWVAFGRTTGLVSLCIASVNYAFVDFGGYFLAESPITLVATLSIALYLLAMKLAAKPPSVKRTLWIVAISVLGGFLFSCAMALKMVAMFAIMGFAVLHLLFSKTPKSIMRLIVLGIFCVSAMPVTAKMVTRCTTANEGHFCTGSNKSAADFLLGHYDRIQGIEWHDPKTRGVVGFGSPAAVQHGYRNKQVVPFAITDQQKNGAAAWKWIGENPFPALVLSFEHVWDCFGTYPWPPNATSVWPASYFFHYLFYFLILVPALIRIVDVLRTRGIVGMLRSMDFFILSPVFGVCLAVFVATGEERYRVPWDGAFIVLAVEFYRHIKLRFWEPGDKPKSDEKAAAKTDGKPAPSTEAKTDEKEAAAPVEAEPKADAIEAKPKAAEDKPSDETASSPSEEPEPQGA